MKKNKSDPSNYTPKSGRKAWWICGKCGHKWHTSICNRTGHYKTGCPQCAESKGEKRIRNWFDEYNVYYKREYFFNDLLSDLGNPLRFDFAIFDGKELKSLIEYDGVQHFEWFKGWMPRKQFDELQYHDRLKNTYCKNNNIPLLRIRYDEFDKIDNILKEYLVYNLQIL